MVNNQNIIFNIVDIDSTDCPVKNQKEKSCPVVE